MIKMPPATCSLVKACGIILPICLVDMETVLILAKFNQKNARAGQKPIGYLLRKKTSESQLSVFKAWTSSYGICCFSDPSKRFQKHTWATTMPRSPRLQPSILCGRIIKFPEQEVFRNTQTYAHAGAENASNMGWAGFSCRNKRIMKF